MFFKVHFLLLQCLYISPKLSQNFHLGYSSRFQTPQFIYLTVEDYMWNRLSKLTLSLMEIWPKSTCVHTQVSGNIWQHLKLKIYPPNRDKYNKGFMGDPCASRVTAWCQSQFARVSQAKFWRLKCVEVHWSFFVKDGFGLFWQSLSLGKYY